MEEEDKIIERLNQLKRHDSEEKVTLASLKHKREREEDER